MRDTFRLGFGSGGRGVLLLAGIALIACLGGMLAAAVDSSAAKRKPVRVQVKVATKNQAQLLKAGKLKLRIKSSRKAVLKVKAVSGKRRNLFRDGRIRIRRAGVSTPTIRLTKAGRKFLSTCGAKTLKVTLSAKGKVRLKGKRKATKRLSKDANRCRPLVTVPLGENPEQCDFLDPTVCLQPFANDYYTVADGSTATGRRLALGAESTPINSGTYFEADRRHIDVTDINRGDGFSPGNMITLKVPGLDTPAAFTQSGLVSITDLKRYKEPGQAMVVINAETGERQPIWAELDSNPTTLDPNGSDPGGPGTNPTNTGPVNLMIRPARNFDYGARYIVILRNLKDATGAAIESPLGFRVYRDDLRTNQEIVENRRKHMESVIETAVSKAGVDRKSLYMAWDFTVASRQSITGRALQVRDEAFAALGDENLADRVIAGNSPTWTIDNVDLNPQEGILKRITGKITNIPCFLNKDGCPSGAGFDFDETGKVKRNPAFTVDAPFRCEVPSSLVSGVTVTPGLTGTYGHGLLGSLGQVGGQNQYANETNTIWCAMNWDGFSNPDLGSVLSALADLSKFPVLVDRMQQGFLNFMYLQRALVHPSGLTTDPAFTYDAGSGNQPLIDTSAGVNSRGQYMGVSQGGIMGGALVALSPDADRGVLDVPGMNYSLLLRRSVDSDEYFKTDSIGLYANYTELKERPVLLSLIQLLWDRGEGNGYAQSLGDQPLPNTPPHDVLLRLALGDHQVTNVSAEVMARTVGAKVYAPALNPGRHWEQTPFTDLDQVTSFPAPAGDSWLVYYDGGPVGYMNSTPHLPGDRSECDHGDPVSNPCPGSGQAPFGNVPPREEWGYGGDPHNYPRYSRDSIAHGKSFLGNGTIGLCHSGSYCYANNWEGPTP